MTNQEKLEALFIGEINGSNNIFVILRDKILTRRKFVEEWIEKIKSY